MTESESPMFNNGRVSEQGPLSSQELSVLPGNNRAIFPSGKTMAGSICFLLKKRPNDPASALRNWSGPLMQKSKSSRIPTRLTSSGSGEREHEQTFRRQAG